MVSWNHGTRMLSEALGALSVRDRSEAELAPDSGYSRWETLTGEIRERGGTVYLIGNGASASMASHLAADLAKNAHVHTEVFSDHSLITAIANDIGYEEVFAEPLRRRMREGEMLVAVSSSGNSPNIVRAADVARARGGLVVTLSAMKPGNRIRAMGDLNFYVPARTYGLAESCHAFILHHWMDRMAENLHVGGTNG